MPAAPLPSSAVMAGGNDGGAGRYGCGGVGGRAEAVACACEAGEEAGVADLGLEADPEGDVVVRGVAVIDLDVVENAGVEGEVVGSVARLEEGIDVHDEGDAIGMVVADEGVEVGDVGFVIERGDRSFAMAGGETLKRYGDEQTQGEGCGVLRLEHGSSRETSGGAKTELL